MKNPQHDSRAEMLFKWAAEGIARQQGISLNKYLDEKSRSGWDLEQFSQDIIRANSNNSQCPAA